MRRATAAVSAHDQQVRLPAGGFFKNHAGNLAAEFLDQPGFHRDARAAQARCGVFKKAQQFRVPAIILAVTPLLSRRWFPFAAPATLWLLGGVLSFIDGRLLPFTSGALVAGLAFGFLLGRLDDATRARAGFLAVLAVQGYCMARLLRDPRGLAPWYNATGVSLYVLGMLAAAFALAATGARP